MSDVLGSQTLILVKDGEVTGTDDYGAPIFGPEQDVPIPGCSIEPLQGVASTEQLAAVTDNIVTTWRFFAPATAPTISNRDRARCNLVSVDLQVDGDPVMWPDENGDPHHIEGYLKRWVG